MKALAENYLQSRHKLVSAMPRYSRDDALSERKMELLLEAARNLKEPRDFEARVIIFCAGRLGMRGGEIAHMRSSWIDMDERVIEIPRHDPCDLSDRNDPCGYCRNRARDYMETHNKSAEDHLSSLEQQFPDTSTDVLRPLAEKQASNEEVTFEEALEMRWQPKNENAVRTIPFDFDVRVQLTIERFCDKYDVFPKSKATINRRIKRVVEESEISKRVYPHSLRATAATLHAARDVSPYSLMSVMGWSTMDTARSYIASSNETAAKELRGTYR